MPRRRCAPRPARRTLFCGLLVLAALGAIASSALSGAGQSTPNDSAYVQLVDLREYAGTGFGGESAHVVRLDFQVTPGGSSTTGSSTGGTTGSTTSSTTGSSTTGSTTSSTTGSTTSSTTGSTTGSTTSSTTGSSTTGGSQPPSPSPQPVADALSARRAPGGKAFRGKPRPWLLRRDQRPLANEGVRLHPGASDMIDVPPSMRAAGVSVQPAMARPTTTGSTTSTTGSTTSSTTGSTTSSTTGSTTSSTTGSSTSGGTTGNNGSWSTSTVNYYFGVDSSYFAALTVGGQHPASDWPGTYGVSAYNVSRGNHFEFRLPPASTSRNVYYLIDASGASGYYDANNNPVTTSSYHTTDVYSTALALSRRDTPTVSVDSRKGYGQPDIDGATPTDPNADLRNPSFANWIYKGGLFVGNAPPGSGDQSGTARIQAYVPAGTFNNPLASSFTLLALGRPAMFPSPPAYAAYLPSPSDPNLGSSPATVTWANAWNLTTATALGSGDDLSANSFPAGGLEYSRCFFVGNASDLIVALQNEASAVGQGAGYWQYFSSPGYQAGFPNTFPISDSSPRTWTADETGYGYTRYQLQ